MTCRTGSFVQSLVSLYSVPIDRYSPRSTSQRDSFRRPSDGSGGGNGSNSSRDLLCVVANGGTAANVGLGPIGIRSASLRIPSLGRHGTVGVTLARRASYAPLAVRYRLTRSAARVARAALASGAAADAVARVAGHSRLPLRSVVAHCSAMPNDSSRLDIVRDDKTERRFSGAAPAAAAARVSVGCRRCEYVRRRSAPGKTTAARPMALVWRPAPPPLRPADGTPTDGDAVLPGTHRRRRRTTDRGVGVS